MNYMIVVQKNLDEEICPILLFIWKFGIGINQVFLSNTEQSEIADGHGQNAERADNSLYDADTYEDGVYVDRRVVSIVSELLNFSTCESR